MKTRRGALAALALLLAGPAVAGHRHWYTGAVGSGATQWNPPGIQRDAGASTFPVVTTGSGTGSSGTTFLSSAFSTSSSAGLLVVVVSMGNLDGNNQGQPVLTGAGLTWTKRVEALITSAPSAVTHLAQVWTAPYSSAISSQQLTLTMGFASIDFARSLTIDALAGWAGTFGATATNTTSSSAETATLSGVASGSWSYVGVFRESTDTTVTPNGSTTELSDAFLSGPSPTVGTASGISTTGTGSLTLGWTNTMDFGAVAALEVKSN